MERIIGTTLLYLAECYLVTAFCLLAFSSKHCHKRTKADQLLFSVDINCKHYFGLKRDR